jgi:excisionase family DNA binding protein
MHGPIAEYTADRISEGVNEEINSLLTVGEAARLLQVHVNTVRRWSNLGILKSYRVGSRSDRRFHKEDIIKLLME